MLLTRAAAVGGVSVVLLAAARVAASVPSTPLPFQRATEPPSYTFRLDVSMAMRHFPWFHFHMAGIGVYQPGVSYVVHFTSLPWFIPHSHHDADLSMIDPLMWPRHYTFAEIGQRDGDTLFALHSLDDPSLRDATVAVGPNGTANRVDATYTDGTRITMQVSSSNVDGFLLPVTMTADIDEPHLALAANADFTNYDFSAEQQSRAASQ